MTSGVTQGLNGTAVANFEPPETYDQRSIFLPNPEGALAEVNKSGAAPDLGLYTGMGNNCYTYCATVLQAGGVEGLPSSPLLMKKFFQGLPRFP